MKRLIFIILLGQFIYHASVLAGGNVAAGKDKSQTCVACHGENGISPIAQFPNIAGQYRDYLYKTLTDYKSGKRNNPIMLGIVIALSDQDMQDLAVYFASQDGLFNIDLTTD